MLWPQSTYTKTTLRPEVYTIWVTWILKQKSGRDSEGVPFRGVGVLGLGFRVEGLGFWV